MNDSNKKGNRKFLRLYELKRKLYKELSFYDKGKRPRVFKRVSKELERVVKGYKRRGRFFWRKSGNLADWFLCKESKGTSLNLLLFLLDNLECLGERQKIKRIKKLIEKILKLTTEIALEHGYILYVVYKRLSKQYYNLFLIKEDLKQEGFIGLMRAVLKYDIRKKDEVHFRTYAFYWVRKHMLEECKRSLFNKQVERNLEEGELERRRVKEG